MCDLNTLELWSQQIHVVRSIPDGYWDWETDLSEDPEWRLQIISEVNGQPLGFIQIIDPFYEPTRYWGMTGRRLRAIDIWIGMPENIGRGFGTSMMQWAIARCFSNPDVTDILIDPLYDNKKAQRFYRRLGFLSLGKRRFDDSEAMVMILSRKRWEKVVGNDKKR
jgi:aminoglycoside 6'-N-acetyltransferase